jgi:hypothetical protein
LAVIILLRIGKDIVEYLSQHPAADLEGGLHVVLIPEQPQDYFLERNVFVPVDVFGVVVGDEGAVHATDLQLEGVFHECAPDEVVVLPLEALEITLEVSDGIVLVELPVLDVVSDGADSSGFDLEDEGIAVLIDVPAIYLRSEQKIAVDCAVPVVALWRL